MKISIVPEIINSQEIEIFDDNGVPISICHESGFKFDYPFENPSIIIDNFEKKRYKNIEIIRIDLPHIDKFGYRLVSINTKGHTNIRNYPGQKKGYMLKRKKDPLEGGFEILRIPNEHYIEMDTINNRIRIRGKNAYPYIKNENASEWINLKNDR